MQQITNGQRPATKQRDTDIIISRQTQTNIRNLKISNPYTKATQNNKQNKNKYGQSIQHNKKRMQSKEKIKNKHKQTHKSPTTIKTVERNYKQHTILRCKQCLKNRAWVRVSGRSRYSSYVPPQPSLSLSARPGRSD